MIEVRFREITYILEERGYIIAKSDEDEIIKYESNNDPTLFLPVRVYLRVDEHIHIYTWVQYGESEITFHVSCQLVEVGSHLHIAKRFLNIMFALIDQKVRKHSRLDAN